MRNIHALKIVYIFTFITSQFMQSYYRLCIITFVAQPSIKGHSHNYMRPGNLIMYWTYSRQSLLSLKNLRFTAALEYNVKKRTKYLEINGKFQFKEIKERKYGTKSLHRQWDTNSGVHWEVLLPISLSLQSMSPRYLSASLNVRSFSSNLLQIQYLLESSSLDILALTETLTKQNQSLEIVQGTLLTMGYSLVSSHRPDRIGGGLGLIHKDSIEVKKKDAGIRQTFEHLTLELQNNSIIAIIYWPPNTAVYTFLEEFAEWVSHLLNKYMDPLILGDLNINLQKLELPNSAAFLECLDSYALKQWVLDSTHQSGSLLDHVITRENSTLLLDRPEVLELISDHRLIRFDISKHQLPCKPTMIKFRKLNDIPSQVIKQEISDVLNLCDGIKDPSIYWKVQIRHGWQH